MVIRRQFLVAAGTAAAAALVPDWARAAVARGLPLATLVGRSAHIVRGVALEAFCEWAHFGDQRRIVTYTRLRVDEPLAGVFDPELLVRTLGGSVGEIGQVVPGEATLLLGEDCVAFLSTASDGVLGVTAMAQGHYPLKADDAGAMRLVPSPTLAMLLDDKTSAVARLRGRTLPEARQLVQQGGRK